MSPSFHVSYSGAVRDLLKRILRDATSQSPEFGRLALAAAKAIDARLRSAAREFGEPALLT